LIYGECEKNTSAAARLYSQHFPNRRAPADITFKRLESSLRESWPPWKKLRERTATGPENEITVLGIIDENPHISQNMVSRATNISQSSVHRIIKGNKFHQYHVHLQKLKETDYPKRLDLLSFFSGQPKFEC
ncbi:HTH 24 domain containing protein, partial [Asbolus verrucosus]